MIEESDTGGNLERDYVFFAGRRIASVGNMISNAGFQNGSTGWSLPGAFSVVDDPSNAQSGCCYLTGGGPADEGFAVGTGTNGSNWIPVKPGQTIAFGGWIKRTGGTGILDWGCEIVDGSYNLAQWCGCGAASLDGSGGTNWQYYSTSITVASNGAYVQFFAEVHGRGDSDKSDTTGDWQWGFMYTDSANYFFADALGSTRAVTDSSGNVCFSADYYPYGQENDYVTSCSPTYRFTGYEYDSETGNYYAYARYYNPRLGRFMSPDPLGGSVDDPQSLNRYSYGLNDPASSRGPRELSATLQSAVVASLDISPLSPSLALPNGAGSQGPGASGTQGLSGAQGARAAFEEFRLDYLIFRAKATNPYSNSFGEATGALGPSILGSTRANLEGQILRLGGMLGSSPLVPFDNPSEAEILSALQVDFFNTSNMSNSFTGLSGNLQAGFATYIYALNNIFGMHYGFGLGSMNGNLSFAVDPSFPGFDVNMFFGGGGGFSGNGECGVGGWNDVCSL